MDIEQLATSAVSTAISRSEYLKADIHFNDKKPLWDGDIEVYKKPSMNHAKHDLYARIPVQVKGKLYKKTKKFDSLEYQVSIADLRNYLKDGGVIYFVVTLFKSTQNITSVIFYAPLLPYELRKLLNQNDGKQTCNISLLPFPEDIDDMTQNIKDIATNMLKQRANITNKLITLDDIKNSHDIANMISEYTFSCIKWKDDIDVFDSLLHTKVPIYIYAHMKDGVYFPLAKLFNIQEINAKKPVEANISIGNRTYYKNFTLLCIAGKNKRQDEVHLGKNIKISWTKSAESETQLSFTMQGTLSERINDIEFILALIKARHFEVDGEICQIGDMMDVDSLGDINSLKKMLEWFLNIKKLLNYLDVTEELDYDSVTLKDEHILQSLIASVLENKKIKLNNVDSVLSFLKIANLNICVYTIETEKMSSQYYVGNFFDSGIRIQDTNENLVSYYTFFKRDFLLNCSNLNFSKMLADIRGIPMSKVYADRLVNLLLELFYAYDESKRQDILDAAIELAGYLKTEDTFTPIAVTKLNYYQAILRRRELEKNEIAELLELTEDKEQSEEIFTAAYLLLKNQIAAKIHFDKMSIDERQEFEKYPIYRFWQNR